MMPINYNRFTNRTTRSELEIRSPHFYAGPSPAGAVRKRSGFAFPSTDRVTQSVGRNYNSFTTVQLCSNPVLGLGARFRP